MAAMADNAIVDTAIVVALAPALKPAGEGATGSGLAGVAGVGALAGGATYAVQQTTFLAAASAPDRAMVEAVFLRTIFNGHPQSK